MTPSHNNTPTREVDERLFALAEASQHLLGALESGKVVSRVLELAQRLFRADACAVWRLNAEETEWQVVSDVNLSEGYSRSVPYQGCTELHEPLFIRDVDDAALLSQRHAVLAAEGVRSLLVLPLCQHGAPGGFFTFYFRQRREPAAGDLKVAAAFANLAAAAITTSELYQAEHQSRATAESSQKQLAFAAEASMVLASSLDYNTTLQHVAELAVPRLADWCVMHAVEENGAVSAVALAHADPDKVRWAQEVLRKYPYNPEAQSGVARVLRTGESELCPQITGEQLEQFARDEEHLVLLREVGFNSSMIVPLKARGRVLGVLSLISAESGRRYSEADLRFAEDLAARAAVAIDNARLHRVAEREIAKHRSTQDALQTSNARLEFLLDTARHLLASRNPQVFIHEVYDRLSQELGLEVRLHFLTSEDGSVLRLGSHAGVGPEVAAQISSLSVEEGVSAWVGRRRERLVVEEVQRSSDSRAELIRALGVAAYVCYPLVSDGRLLGTISFGTRNRERFRPAGLALMQAASDLIAVALDRAELNAEAVRRAEELGEMNRRKDEFLAMLSHEMRNPLAGMSNALALWSPAQAQQVRLHGIVTRQLRQLTRIVNDLLDVSRMTRGVVQLRTDCVDLRKLVEEAVESVEPELEKRGHSLAVYLPSEPVLARADPVRMTQVLTNLLDNAARYTPEGGRVQVSLVVQGFQALLTVRDNGDGISVELLPRLFEPFLQSERALDRSQGGLGVGLALARNLVELHGGSIRAHSDGPGHGSEFEITLPLPVSPPAVKPAGGGSSSPVLCPLRLLVVEDNRDAAETLQELLEVWGHEVCVTHSGPEALDVAGSFGPDVILCDIGLPGMDGYELAERLKAHPDVGRTYLVALTGYGSVEDRKRSQAAGFALHLTKPVDPAVLRRVLAEYAQALVSKRPSQGT